MFAARLSSSVLAFVVLTAACGGGSSESDQSSATEAPAGPVTAQGAASAESDTSVASDGDGSQTSGADPAAVEAAPESIEEFEASWAAARAAVVESIRAGGYGVDEDNVLIGPGGFEVDLNRCPVGWRDQQGLEDSILIGQTAPRSGNLFAYGFIATGLEAYFEHVNSKGGIGGRPLELLIKDDGYDSGLTVELVDELIEGDAPFAVTTFGPPGSFAVRDQLNSECIPHPFVMSNHPAWGDPEGYPWTTGLQLAYTTEALLWGRWIEQNMADQLPVTVGALVIDSEFGRVYEDTLAGWAADNPDVIAEMVSVRHDPEASSVAEEVGVIAAGAPDVFVAMTNGNPCLAAVQAAGQVGLGSTDVVRFTSSACKNPDLYMAPAGAAADGFQILGGGWKVTSGQQYEDDPFIAWVNATLADAGADTAIGFFGTGFAYYGWAYVEALRIASELDGGLSRTNFLLAQRAMDLNHPALLDGIAFSTSGLDDGYFVEGSDVLTYRAETETWEETGPVIDVDGATANCRWRDTSC